jgi:drug/metabolite transporter (DMT)-like permease
LIAILGGIGAAACFASSTLCSSRSSRMIEPGSVLAWVMLVGLLVTLPAVAVAGPPSEVSGTDLGWLAVIGITNSVGLLLVYRALRVGKVGLVAPVVSTEGAIAAVLAIAGGEGIAPGTGALLAVIGTGVCLAALAPGEGEAPAGRPARGMGYAVAAACSFGLTLYATARAGAHLPVAWLLVPARVAGVLLFAVPLALVGRLRLTRPAVPLVIAAGLSEVLGVASYALGARHGIAVASVLASQFATISAVAGYLLFRERLAGVQVLGVAATVLGVAALSAIQA